MSAFLAKAREAGLSPAELQQLEEMERAMREAAKSHGLRHAEVVGVYLAGVNFLIDILAKRGRRDV